VAIFQVVIKQRWLGQEVRNVLYYDTDLSALTAAQRLQLADGIRAMYVTFATSRLVNDWSLYAFDIRRVDVPGEPTLEVFPTAGTFVGPVAVESLPTQVALLMHGFSQTSRPNRIRQYIGGLGEGSMGDGIWLPGAVSGANTLGSSLLAPTVTGSSRFDRVAAGWNPSRTQVVAFNKILLIGTTEIPATQRRRRIGRGA
jgi:hypothetical protein